MQKLDLSLSAVEIKIAAQQEENERLKNQIEYLSNRVVLLRALLNQTRKDTETNNAEEAIQENSSLRPVDSFDEREAAL